MQAGLIAQAGRRAIKQKAEAALIPDPFVTLICSVKTNHYIIQAGDLKSTLVFSHTTLGTSVWLYISNIVYKKPLAPLIFPTFIFHGLVQIL